jgi:hypothetical protein
VGQGAEGLTTGWEPDVPVDDTLLRRFLFNWVADQEAHAEAMGGRVLRRDDVAATDWGRPAGFFNCAVLLRPFAHDPGRVLDVLDTFYFGEARGTGMVVLASPWPTADLRHEGWRLMGHPPLHLRPAGGALPPFPAGLRIEAVRDVAALRAFEEVVVDGYPVEELQPFSPGALLDEQILADPRARRWVGWEGDRPVSAAAAFVAHGVVNVEFVATVPEARRRGFGEAVTWRAALAEPGLPAMLLSSDHGRSVYERMGFLPLLRWTMWYRERPPANPRMQ